MIKIQNYSIKNVLLTNKVLSVYITKFWNDVYSQINSDNHLWLMCKVHYSESELGYRTLGHLRRVNFTDKELFINYLSDRLGILNDSYTTLSISQISFSYIINEGLASDKDKLLLQNLEDKSLRRHIFYNYKLPISMNPSDYGLVISSSTFDSFVRFIVKNGTRIYQIDSTLDRMINNVTILGASDFKWVDTALTEGFHREIGKSTIYFVDGEVVLRKQQLNAKAFSKLSVDKNLPQRFVTMDIETIKNGDFPLTPYLICAYNGSKTITSYGEMLNGEINQKALFSNFITQLLTLFYKKSTKLVVYAHNLSGFDGVFLMKHLLTYGKVEPLIHNGKIISIKLKLNLVGYTNKTIVFKDSYLLLPLSLRKLCAAFNVIMTKGYFPFNLNNIFYKGLFPKFEYWTGITLSEYETLLKEYTGITWNFKTEAIKYCILDCQSLYEVITIFNKLIYSHFKINAHNSLTLPALAMRIYKTHYMPENTIYQLVGNIERDIRESYTGGAVDVYIPHNRITKFFSKIKAMFVRLYIYDANSLYPFVMANTPMPIGKPYAFSGDIRKIDPDAYGFFYCKITSPKYLEHPILQRRIKTANGIRTVAGLGSWIGWIYSAEMDNAMKFGYTFEILKGSQFQKGYIFKEYVDKMYNLRLEYDKGHPLNLIAKLLMNSLYGKFAMKLESTKVDIFDTSNEFDTELLKDMMDLYGESIRDYIKLDNHIITIRNSLLHYEYNEKDDLFHGLDINIAIASAVTAGGRMWMSIIKNNPLFKLYYSDTDSAAIDRPLPSYMVGNKLGQFKLENIAERAVFLAPKVYALITDDGREIVKVKGITNEIIPNIHIADLENLLIFDSTQEFIQDKMYKKVIEGEISIQEMAYTLKTTSNKRDAIYVNGVFNATKPYYYNEINQED